MFSNCGSCGGTGVDLILPDVSVELRLFLLSAGEHILLILMFAFFTSSPVSTLVLQEQYRQKLYENRLKLEAASEGQVSQSMMPRRSRKETQDTCISTDHV